MSEEHNIVYDAEFVDRYMERSADGGFPIKSRAEASRNVKNMFGTLIDCLLNDETVSRQGFGKFEIRHRASRKGRNPQTGEELVLPASTTVGFKASRKLKRIVSDELAR